MTKLSKEPVEILSGLLEDQLQLAVEKRTHPDLAKENLFSRPEEDYVTVRLDGDMSLSQVECLVVL